MSATTTSLAPTPSSTDDPVRVIPTLVVAFSADPVVRWFLRESTPFLTHFPALLRIFADVATTEGSLDVSGASAGAAIWHAPGAVTDDAALADLLATGVDVERHEDAFGFLERMATCHPTEPHWYLPFIGVDPSCQGEGHGSRLLARGLDRSDRDGFPAYLEASSPRNRRLYERHGFEAFDEIRVADSPPMWPMFRTAR